MKGKNTWAIPAVILVGIVLGFFILRLEPAGTEEHEAQSEQEETLIAKGPHGGRQLTQDGFEVEITIYERGVPPEFRVYAYEQGKPLLPDQVQMTIELYRLGGGIERIQFRTEGDYLRGDRVIEEPHSFDVKVSAMRESRRYDWEYTQVEGRVQLSHEALQSSGIETMTAGPASIKALLELPGEIKLDQNRLAHVVPRFAGVVTAVHKNLGDKVRMGEVIAIVDSLELADAKGQYIESVHRLELAQTIFIREESLWRSKISPEQDYLNSRHALEEAEITKQIAAQKLLALGLSHADLATLSIEPEGPVRLHRPRMPFREQMLTRYEIRAALEGVVIEKHLVLGEAIKEDTAIFMIADLSTVWGEFSVYAKDLNAVRLGQEVTVRSEVLAIEATATVSYLGPLVGEETRAARAHVHIPNPDGRWRPGLFVTVEVVRQETKVPVAVAAEAIQTYRDWSVVFGQYGDDFEVRPLELGRSDGQMVEVVKGLSAGERYAARGSFVLKAELGKSSATHEH
ncbi:MAG: efflux RND transporter periplasmic adaptor subunit [Gammaproteobacteria bacterium]